MTDASKQQVGELLELRVLHVLLQQRLLSLVRIDVLDNLHQLLVLQKRL